MEETILRQSVEIERLAARTAEQTLVEGEVALPGGIREEAAVLGCEARLVVSGVEPQTDRLALDGAVVFQVLYRQGDDAVRVLEANCAFSHMMHMEGVTPGMRPKVVGDVQGAVAQPVSGRMRLRAQVDVNACVFAPEQVEMVTGVRGVQGLQTREETCRVLRHAASGSASALLREEFELPASPAVGETLYARAAPYVRSVSGGEGRASVEGDVTLEVFHPGQGEDGALVVSRHVFPFEQSVALDGEPGDDLRARVQVQDVVASSVDAGDGTRILRTETVLDVAAESFRQEELTTLRDAYTLCGDMLSLDARPVACVAGAQHTTAVENDKLVMALPAGAQPVGHVLAALLKPAMVSAEQVGGRTVVEGLLDAQVVYAPAPGGAPVGVREEIPFRIAFQGSLPQDAVVRMTAGEVHADGIAADRIELKYRMEMDADAVQTQSVALPVGVQMRPAEAETGGLAMVWPQAGETLWDIAKRLRVTPESIARLNPGMEEAKPGKGVLVLKRL